ncbi:MAG: flagella assembly protein FlgT middle domain-containing protein [Pseudomonadota bacterium]|uniref:flagella assembly protein FlgT middle domain-containing protein n=1 Tax=Gallaecimonas pentaromativorans TaxID=584787 RepID=UPI00067F5A07|nr:flagella assembly protein FlgT middle domain-containing protein [Gallaecimonas pentaromativorans]MED5526730.1 flagella assembly protein FlgT middle domain-containing protein [Pseudomonadota bacterium]
MKLPILLFALLTLPAEAAWYQVTGYASLSSDDPKAQATDDALAQARFYAGVRPGAEGDDPVRQIQQYREKEQDGQLALTLLVELDDNGQYQCRGTQPVSLHRLSWASPDQAITGLIGDPGQGIAAEMARLLRERHGALMPVQGIGATLDQSQGRNTDDLQQVAEEQGARYLVGGRLLRITDKLQSSPWYLPWQDDHHQLSMAVDTWLIDSFSGKRLFERRYIASGVLPTGTLLDTQEPSFWLSPFGQHLQRQLQQWALDVESALPCQTSQWPVLAVSDEGVLIDTGSQGGIHSDDHFTVLQKRTLTTSQGERRQVLVPSSQKLSVAWQSATQTLLASKGTPSTLQAGDFVVKTPD